MRKVLYLQWDCFCEEYLCTSLKKAGLEVEMYPLPYGKVSMRHDETFELQLKEHLNGKQYEFVFSFNYFPAVALATHAVNVQYVSWTYDSPFMYIYSTTIALPNVIAFCFDNSTVNLLRQKGINSIYYLPMAAPVDVYDRFYSSSRERKVYGADISFVGSMYTEARQDLMKYLRDVSPEIQSYLDYVIELQLQSYAVPIMEQFLKPDILAELQKVCPIVLDDDEMQTDAWMYANYFLAREATARERTKIIRMLSEKYYFKLFTPEDTPNIPMVDNAGPIDYCDVMPHVFKNTKINLNISLKSIYSGIPLRAFDVLGCKGFLLSDFQSDFGELFVPDEDYVFYTTEDDLYIKVKYYLEHEDKRLQIAQRGYEKVKEKHTYDIRVQEILNML